MRSRDERDRFELASAEPKPHQHAPVDPPIPTLPHRQYSYVDDRSEYFFNTHADVHVPWTSEPAAPVLAPSADYVQRPQPAQRSKLQPLVSQLNVLTHPETSQPPPQAQPQHRPSSPTVYRYSSRPSSPTLPPYRPSQSLHMPVAISKSLGSLPSPSPAPELRRSFDDRSVSVSSASVGTGSTYGAKAQLSRPSQFTGEGKNSKSEVRDVRG